MTIISMLIENASWVETAVAIVAFIGFALNVWAWTEAYLDKRALRKIVGSFEDARFSVLAMHMRTAVFHIITKFIFTALGLYHMFLPTRPDRPVGFRANLTSYLLTVIVLLMTASSVLHRSDRLRFVNRVAKNRKPRRKLFAKSQPESTPEASSILETLDSQQRGIT